MLFALDDDADAWGPIGVGEVGQSLVGWRRSHLQAQSAYSAAVRRWRPARYADVGLFSAIEADTVLVTSLRERYLMPLGQGQQAQRLMETLQAYFAARRNRKAAAAKLSISRQALSQRLSLIQERLGRFTSIDTVEMEIAVGLASTGHFDR